MNRKSSILAVGAAFLLSVTQVRAQQSKVHRIGVLLPGGALYETVDGLKAGLRELGLEEGKQFTLTIGDTKGDVKAAAEAARNFEQEKVSLIYALATSVITAARAATADVPIVFCVGSDPVTGGLVDSFAKPGGRLTGVHFLLRDLTAKRLEILKEVLPKLSRVVTFYDPGNRVPTEAAKSGREEAKRLGLKFIERHVKSVEELRQALQTLKAGEADAFFYTPKAKKLATMFQESGLVAKGGLASYGQNYYQLGWLSAKYVQKVLSGTPPRDLRIETVEDVELAINLKTAKDLGLTIPPNVLARAKRVIK
jgi:putative ABC transport system substrate-binding protein